MLDALQALTRVLAILALLGEFHFFLSGKQVVAPDVAHVERLSGVKLLRCDLNLGQFRAIFPSVILCNQGNKRRIFLVTINDAHNVKIRVQSAQSSFMKYIVAAETPQTRND